jgi:predicted Zn-ribbon and HTH transcriptional regulator
MTRRQRLLALLAAREWTFAALRAELVVPTHVLEDDFARLRRSLAARPGARLEVVAAACPRCGFRFADRERFVAPSRCPRCREEGLLPARFRVTGQPAAEGPVAAGPATERQRPRPAAGAATRPRPIRGGRAAGVDTEPGDDAEEERDPSSRR